MPNKQPWLIDGEALEAWASNGIGKVVSLEDSTEWVNGYETCLKTISMLLHSGRFNVKEEPDQPQRVLEMYQAWNMNMKDSEKINKETALLLIETVARIFGVGIPDDVARSASDSTEPPSAAEADTGPLRRNSFMNTGTTEIIQYAINESNPDTASTSLG